MSAYLVVQNELRKSKEKGDSFNITMAEFSRSTGTITDNPLSIWQSTLPDGAVPGTVPFIADVDLGVRQFNGKDGRQTSVFVKAFRNCELLKIEGVPQTGKNAKPQF